MRFFSKHRIYLDYASAPPVSQEAREAMRHVETLVGNPGAIHREAVASQKVLEQARVTVAAQLGVKSREIVFTSGLTEANNLAILGHARKLQIEGVDLATTHWIVASIEHSSILECFGEVERLGGRVSFVDPDERGIIAPETLARALSPETVFVSIGWANNETGVIQSLSDISRVVRAHEEANGAKVLLHSDAGQAPLYLPTTAHSLGIDLLSVGSNKLYGPHGIGALYINNRAEIAPVVLGGKQERWLRAGTESIELAAGFSVGYETSVRIRETEAKRLRALRDAFKEMLLESIPGLVVNGDTDRALPHMLNVSIPGIQSEYVTLALDAAGIAVSTKSACREGEEAESHAIAALYRAPEDVWKARNTLRFSLGRDTTKMDLARTVKALSTVTTAHGRKEAE